MSHFDLRVEDDAKWWLGQKLATFDAKFAAALAASDAPVAAKLRHRRG